jgi:hypothetical protein
MTLERPGFLQQLLQTVAQNRTPLQWATFALQFAGIWLVMVGLIIAASFWIPQSRTGWILLIALGPPAWLLGEFLLFLLYKSKLYQRTIGGLPAYARISLGVVLLLGLLFSGYAAFSVCAWVVSEL